MKKLSILTSVIMVLASVFYALDIISKNNECTSVRKYYCTKKEVKPETDTGSVAKTQTGELADTSAGSDTQELKVVDDKVIADITPAGDLFAKGLETKLSKILSKDNVYELIYEGADSLIVDISKDRYWTDKVILNGKELSRDEINAYFYTK